MTTSDREHDANIATVMTKADAIGIDMDDKPEDFTPEEWLQDVMAQVLWYGNKRAELQGETSLEVINFVLKKWGYEPLLEGDSYREGFDRVAGCLKLMEEDRQ